MDDHGPSTRHLTKPAQSDRKRFELEWHVPLEPGLPTFVTLFDLDAEHPHIIATGDGGDEAESLSNLWRTLSNRNEPDETIAFVAAAYERRTGRSPERFSA